MNDLRLNQTGQPMIPQKLRDQVLPGYPEKRFSRSEWTLEDHQEEMKKFNLPSPAKISGTVYNVSPKLPQLLGGNIIDHVEQMGMELMGPLDYAVRKFLSGSIPPMPTHFQEAPGWTRYAPGEAPTKATEILEDVMVFDVETLVKLGAWPVMAAAVTSKAWYIWIHPSVVTPTLGFEPMLIKLGTGKIVINHNVSYDRIRVEDEYSLDRTGNYFIDTMSMHTATSGLASEMKKLWPMVASGRTNWIPGWFSKGSPNSLVHSYNFHVHNVHGKPNAFQIAAGAMTEDDKLIRAVFVEASSIRPIQLQRLLKYAATDVQKTWELAKVLYPKYRANRPSWATLAGMVLMNSSILPVSTDWYEWYEGVEAVYHQSKRKMAKALEELALSIHDEWERGVKHDKDPWLKHLDWTPASSGKNKNKAAWFRSAVLSKNAKDITTKSRLAPLLLRISWEGKPLVYLKKFAWCFPVSPEELDSNEAKENRKGHKTWRYKGLPVHQEEGQFYCRVPHVKGEEQNCGDPLTKDYISNFEDGLMGSEDPRAQEILKIAASIAYWTSVRGRVKDQKALPVKNRHGKDARMIIPGVVPHGTITGRAMEKLWLTASGAKAHKIGSETKSRVHCPEGYLYVAADFDAQEKAIGSRLSAAWRFGVLGSTPMEYITISGNKNDGTDAHSQLMSYLNRSLWEYRSGTTLASREAEPDPSKYPWPIPAPISRNESKDPNFAIAYGSGLAGLARTFRKIRKEWPEIECKFLAEKSIKLLKGTQPNRRWRAKGELPTPQNDMWVGGIESHSHNAMQEIAYSRVPTTPALSAKISTALRQDAVRGDFMISIMNWVIQASGQDLLHVVVTGIEWLCRKYEIDGRFCFSYHDELLGMAAIPDVKKFAAAMNVSHLWAWTLLSAKLNLDDVPANGAWFSGTNIDRVFRKEVNDSQLTPSNTDEAPPGTSWSPNDIFEDDADPFA